MRAAVAAHRALDLEGFSRVVDRVYAAGCGETPWDRAVEELCRVGGCDCALLSSVDPLDPRPLLRASHRLGERAGVWSGRMPRNPLLTDDVLHSAPGAVWHDRGVTPPAPLAGEPFWAERMQPSGSVSWACVVVAKEAAQVICLEVYDRCDSASGDRGAVELLVRLAPHLMRAWRLGKARTMPRAALRARVGAPLQAPARSTSDIASMAAMARLRGAFALSKAEARLALHLAAGASLASMAKAFDVKLTTIRSQLQQVFSKTGTCRQSELVALLLSHGYLDPIEP